MDHRSQKMLPGQQITSHHLRWDDEKIDEAKQHSQGQGQGHGTGEVFVLELVVLGDRVRVRTPCPQTHRGHQTPEVPKAGEYTVACHPPFAPALPAYT